MGFLFFFGKIYFLHASQPWEHEEAHEEHVQVEQPQDAHLAAHPHVPDAQPHEEVSQEQAMMIERLFVGFTGKSSLRR